MDHTAPEIKISVCSVPDFYEILKDISDFWGSDRALAVHHPMFVYEFGNSAFVIKEDERVIAYLFGFISQTKPIGYVHLIGVRQSHQLKGLGIKLYAHFAAYAKKHRCTELKAITTPTNTQSIAFHEKMGMMSQLVENYSGLGLDRIVFRKEI